MVSRWYMLLGVLFFYGAILYAVAPSGAIAKMPAQNLSMAYLSYQAPQPPALSNILPTAEDSGWSGAELAVNDSNRTGRFLGQHYDLHKVDVDSPEVLLSQTQALLEQGVRLFVTNLDAEQLNAVHQLAKPYQALIFNAGSADDQLRQNQCLAQVLHTLPSRAMLTDGLAQWLVYKRLKRWLIIVGQQPGDKAYAESLARAAKRFGAKIVAQKNWSFDTDLRRTAQQELPLFTQTKDYDVVVVADEAGDFGEFVLYNTWLPRPVVGTQGLTSTGWHRVVEQWGAAQLQSRFDDGYQRWMDDKDYAAWVAVRTITEAVTRTKSVDVATLGDYIMSGDFELAAYKGRKLSYRSWSGQLRQPIMLVHPRALVSQSPQAGYLHPVTELDTLGFDRRESQCQWQGLDQNQLSLRN